MLYARPIPEEIYICRCWAAEREGVSEDGVYDQTGGEMFTRQGDEETVAGYLDELIGEQKKSTLLCRVEMKRLIFC